jgi:hypothetical protein
MLQTPLLNCSARRHARSPRRRFAVSPRRSLAVSPFRRFSASPRRRLAVSPIRPLVLWFCLLLVAGCTTRRTAAPPAPTYAAVPAASVRLLDSPPSPPFDAVGTITVQANAEISRDRIIADIQKRAGNAGANAIVIQSEKLFTRRIETTRQRLRLRRIVAQEFRLP